MPRIPVRTEPYTSPSRQHRHYKNKRDQVLRSLGKAAYINGSHFAIMWVSARGDVETYASDALQGRLDDWFVKRGVADEAKELVRLYRSNSSRMQLPQPLFVEGDEEGFEDEDDTYAEGGQSDEEGQGGKMFRQPSSASRIRTPLSSTPRLGAGPDVFTDDQASESVRPKLERSASTSMQHGALARSRRAMAPLDTHMANDLFHRPSNNALLATHTAGLGGVLPFRSPFTSMDATTDVEGNVLSSLSLPPFSAPLRGESSFSGLPGMLPATPSLVKTTFRSTAARTAFLELRFSQLQQGMCKTVAKAWIKIIEPKKQTRCPYNKGEEGKPDWWPVGVRHKEPDHLMKPERHALLLTILRSPRVKVARLQLATAEVVALIKADKVSLLDDVYRIAREEEKMRETELDMDAPITVDVSTLEGWSEEGQCVIPVERPQSPGATDLHVEEDGIGSSTMDQSARKRASGTQLVRSASTSQSTRGIKRRTSGPFVFPTNGPGFDPNGLLDPSSTSIGGESHLHGVSNPIAPRRSQGNAQTWLLHEATQHGIKRTSVSSHTLSSHPPLTTSQSAVNQTQSDSGQLGQQHGVQEQYGLITPLTSNTQLMDPSFLTAAKEEDVGRRHESHEDDHHQANVAFMYSSEYSNGFGGVGQQQHPYVYDISAAAAARAGSLASNGQQRGQGQQQQRQHPSHGSAQQSSSHLQHDNNFFAYGQHGQPPQEQARQDVNALSGGGGGGGALGLHGISGVPWSATGNSFANSFGHGGEPWWGGSTIQRGALLPNNGIGEASFDTSFASTIESGGPATPPPAHGGGVGNANVTTGTTSNAKSRTNGTFIWNNQTSHTLSHLTSALSGGGPARSPTGTTATESDVEKQTQRQSVSHSQQPLSSTQSNGNVANGNAFESWMYATQSH